ncbi:hypothetical protein LHJ74_27160 [Streptomyces sp. N2-109]|uniref:DoxX family protein n=1 Tax=Streptomyces gossypii TaxID=2883101 RepID=A0ABT2K1N8_9ACTN|nr:hypothetical protein [Streptomyces gossypii]MCT2593539.1 hypothetical protein [Streptomyces gossypii]
MAVRRRLSGAESLAALLAGAGVAHLAVPKLFDSLVPRALPGSPRAWTYASGAVELVLAAGLAHPRTRRSGGRAAAAYFVAVFPANVKMARDWRDRPAPLGALASARLPLQIPLVWWALRASGEPADGRQCPAPAAQASRAQSGD